MPDMLVLSWDRRRLSGIEISPGGTSPRIQAGFEVDWPEQPPTANWLRETLKRFRVGARHVAVALPREDVVLRLFELPAVGDDELPTLVRFQAAARSAQPLDQLLLDYLPLPVREGVPQKEVWLATTLLTTVEPIQKLLSEAGLELVQLTLSSMCLAELAAQGEARQSLDPAGATLVVVRDGARMELVVMCQRQMIAAHAVKWSSENEIPPVNKMLAEVSRVLVQVQAWLPEGTLQRARVIGEPADVGDLPEAISQRWNCPVELFDPFSSSGISLGSARLEGPSSNYAIAAGLACFQSGALTPKIDLLHPRQPPPKRDLRKPYIVAGSAAALLAVVLMTMVYQQLLASYISTIDQLTTEDRRLDQDLKRGEPTFVAAKAIEEWQSRNINQLKEMGELHEAMNGTERRIVSEYKFAVSSGTVLARIGLIGIARDRNDAEQLAQNLTDLQKYAVRPSAVTTRPGSVIGNTRDSGYASRFDLEMDLNPVSSQAKTAPASTTNKGQ